MKKNYIEENLKKPIHNVAEVLSGNQAARQFVNTPKKEGAHYLQTISSGESPSPKASSLSENTDLMSEKKVIPHKDLLDKSCIIKTPILPYAKPVIAKTSTVPCIPQDNTILRTSPLAPPTLIDSSSSISLSPSIVTTDSLCTLSLPPVVAPLQPPPLPPMALTKLPTSTPIMKAPPLPPPSLLNISPPREVKCSPLPPPPLPPASLTSISPPFMRQEKQHQFQSSQRAPHPTPRGYFEKDSERPPANSRQHNAPGLHPTGPPPILPPGVPPSGRPHHVLPTGPPPLPPPRSSQPPMTAPPPMTALPPMTAPPPPPTGPPPPPQTAQMSNDEPYWDGLKWVIPNDDGDEGAQLSKEQAWQAAFDSLNAATREKEQSQPWDAGQIVAVAQNQWQDKSWHTSHTFNPWIPNTRLLPPPLPASSSVKTLLEIPTSTRPVPIITKEFKQELNNIGLSTEVIPEETIAPTETRLSSLSHSYVFKTDTETGASVKVSYLPKEF